MAEVFQQIKWQLTREKLEQLLKDAGNYTALEFEMCIETGAVTKYYISLVGDAAVASPTAKVPVCPVPPDCD